MLQRWIPRNEAGTRETLAAMAELARDGAAIAPNVENVFDVDGWLRSVWFYVPDGRYETIRTVDRMIGDQPRQLTEYVDGVLFGVKAPGQISGDCDDAGVLGAAMLLRHRQQTAPFNINLVAVRPARSPHFEHVLVTFAFDYASFRVDPTAPTNADYSHWECLVFQL